MMAAVGKRSVLWQTALIAEETAQSAAPTPDASLTVDYTGARSACDLMSAPNPAPAGAGLVDPLLV